MSSPVRTLVICGLTATGKTALGMAMAGRYNGEIVSVDSRQVYQGMDVGTGKEVRAGVKSWLLDLVPPDWQFTVADYLQAAREVFADLRRRGKLPVLVGGTGLYFRALLAGLAPIGAGPDWRLRAKLAGLTAPELAERLKKINLPRWEQMNRSDRHNPRRLVRAIEMTQRTAAPSGRTLALPAELTGEVLKVGLKAALPVLYQLIDARVDKRVNLGIEQEIGALLAQGYNWKDSALGRTIGYREWQGVFTGQGRKAEATQKWKYHEHAYARRQLTWFKKEPDINWFDVGVKDWQNKVEQLIARWYTKKDAPKN